MKKYNTMLMITFLAVASSSTLIQSKDSCSAAKQEELEIQGLIDELEVLVQHSAARDGKRDVSSVILDTIKKIFDKLKKLRKEVKDHSAQIHAAKQGIESVSNALGNPEALEKLSDGADTAMQAIVNLDGKVVEIAQKIQN